MISKALAWGTEVSTFAYYLLATYAIPSAVLTSPAYTVSTSDILSEPLYRKRPPDSSECTSLRMNCSIHCQIETDCVHVDVALLALRTRFAICGNQFATVSDVHADAFHIFENSGRGFQSGEAVRVCNFGIRRNLCWMMDLDTVEHLLRGSSLW